MITLEMYYKECTKKDGTKFKKEYTCVLGFEVQIVFPRGFAQQLKYKDANTNTWYITYDPRKATLRNDNGFMQLWLGV